MTVMSEGLLLNSNILNGPRREGSQAFVTQPPLVNVCQAV